MMHLILLGDSTLHNDSYTYGGPSVTDHISADLGERSAVTRLARDGDMMRDVAGQLKRLPPTATHLVLSVGGNDALGHTYVLERDRSAMTNMFGALSDLTDILDEFQDSYRRCLDRVLEHSLPTTVCTIYNGAFQDPSYQRVISTTARLFDDVIMQCAFDVGCSVVDLRRVCTDYADYYNPIEPGAEGGRKIASTILSVLRQKQSSTSFVYPSGAYPWLANSPERLGPEVGMQRDYG
jgi:hypothetical protein